MKLQNSKNKNLNLLKSDERRLKIFLIIKLSITGNSVEGKTSLCGAAFRLRLKRGFISFGCSAGKIAVMRREIVKRKKWIGAGRFFRALIYVLPVVIGGILCRLAKYFSGI